MTDDRSLERAARSWIEAGPTRAPDHAVDAALRRIDSTAQERALRLPWRLPTMNPLLRLAGVAAAAVLAVGVANFLFNTPASNVGGPPATSPSPSAPPTEAPSEAPPAATLRLPPTPAPVFPETPLPAPPGDPLPDDLIGRTYASTPPEIQDTQELILTLRPADDPHCAAMYDGRSTCFTYLWTPNYPKHVNDPAARGTARIVHGNLYLRFDLLPSFDDQYEGLVATYSIEDDGATLVGIETPPQTVPGFVEKEIPTTP
jgi:hypothetical protein